MITKARIFISSCTNPYRNLAVEEHLLELARDGECILYLWQNAGTVVIGRNQDAFKECKTGQLAADGGFLARRLSGGGSVYHDLQNLNFTFVMKRQDYNVDRQLSVILRALESFGLKAERTGRNDICIDGRKFSGNAFYLGDTCYHHGTLLVDVDLGRMSHYLHVSAEKLKSNSVQSVRSRVVNLRELCPDITVEALRSALVNAFGEIYATPEIMAHSDFDAAKVEALTQKYASEAWRFGEHMKADFTAEKRFTWGEVTVALRLRGGKVEKAQVFSDAMDERIAEVLSSGLRGAGFGREALRDAVARLEELTSEIRSDITDLLAQQEIWGVSAP